MITLIAACSSNRVIGNNNKLIWNMPGDLKRFKSLTSGHTVLMGRKTYDSIGRPLPNRRNVVISRNVKEIEGCLVYSSLIESLNIFANDLFVIGGEEIYRQSIVYADRIELTLIHKEFIGDAYFPKIPSNFVEINRENLSYPEFDYSYITYEKVESKFSDKNISDDMFSLPNKNPVSVRSILNT